MPIYHEFEVSLHYIEPRIWRRFQITKDATFDDLHDAIQAAFDWDDDHLWEFRATLRSSVPLAGPMRLRSRRVDGTVSRAGIKLTRHFGTGKRRRCFYVYDFGDNWTHDVRFLLSVISKSRFHRRLLAGERAGPLEDSGGVRGYLRLVEFCRTGVDPWGEDPDEVRDWVGPWDPDAFDLEKVRSSFAR